MVTYFCKPFFPFKGDYRIKSLAQKSLKSMSATDTQVRVKRSNTGAEEVVTWVERVCACGVMTGQSSDKSGRDLERVGLLIRLVQLCRTYLCTREPEIWYPFRNTFESC